MLNITAFVVWSSSVVCLSLLPGHTRWKLKLENSTISFSQANLSSDLEQVQLKLNNPNDIFWNFSGPLWVRSPSLLSFLEGDMNRFEEALEDASVVPTVFRKQYPESCLQYIWTCNRNTTSCCGRFLFYHVVSNHLISINGGEKQICFVRSNETHTDKMQVTCCNTTQIGPNCEGKMTQCGDFLARKDEQVGLTLNVVLAFLCVILSVPVTYLENYNKKENIAKMKKLFVESPKQVNPMTSKLSVLLHKLFRFQVGKIMLCFVLFISNCAILIHIFNKRQGSFLDKLLPLEDNTVMNLFYSSGYWLTHIGYAIFLSILWGSPFPATLRLAGNLHRNNLSSELKYFVFTWTLPLSLKWFRNLAASSIGRVLTVAREHPNRYFSLLYFLCALLLLLLEVCTLIPLVLVYLVFESTLKIVLFLPICLLFCLPLTKYPMFVINIFTTLLSNFLHKHWRACEEHTVMNIAKTIIWNTILIVGIKFAVVVTFAFPHWYVYYFIFFNTASLLLSLLVNLLSNIPYIFSAVAVIYYVYGCYTSMVKRYIQLGKQLLEICLEVHKKNERTESIKKFIVFYDEDAPLIPQQLYNCVYQAIEPLRPALVSLVVKMVCYVGFFIGVYFVIVKVSVVSSNGNIKPHVQIALTIFVGILPKIFDMCYWKIKRAERDIDLLIQRSKVEKITAQFVEVELANFLSDIISNYSDCLDEQVFREIQRALDNVAADVVEIDCTAATPKTRFVNLNRGSLPNTPV